MKGVDTIARFRREYFVRQRSIREISRVLHVTRNTLRKILRSEATGFHYEREAQPLPMIGPRREHLDRLLMANEGKTRKHPEITDQTIWQVFEAERPHLFPSRGSFNGFHASMASVSKTCLERFDNVRYSVASRAMGRPVEVQADASHILIR